MVPVHYGYMVGSQIPALQYPFGFQPMSLGPPLLLLYSTESHQKLDDEKAPIKNKVM